MADTYTTNYGWTKPEAGKTPWKADYDAVLDSLDTLLANISRPGISVPYAGATAPDGWLIEDGSAVSRVTYAALFAVIGTTYGVGNGSTTFNLPDSRNRVTVGKGSGTFATLGATGGAETHTLSTSEIPSHSHLITLSNNIYGSWAFVAQQNTGTNQLASSTTGGGGAHNNLQPYIVKNHIIKY